MHPRLAAHPALEVGRSASCRITAISIWRRRRERRSATAHRIRSPPADHPLLVPVACVAINQVDLLAVGVPVRGVEATSGPPLLPPPVPLPVLVRGRVDKPRVGVVGPLLVVVVALAVPHVNLAAAVLIPAASGV